MTDRPSLPTDTINGFTYRIRAACTLAFPVAGLSMVGDEGDMERGVLHTPSSSSIARHSYLPVQAVPEGVVTPDLIVDVFDGERILTTLHFCTIWRGMQRNVHPETWERVSFPKRRQALIYNKDRLSFCHACRHLHTYHCQLAVPQAETRLLRALAEHGLAMCLSGGYVYLVACNDDRPLPADQSHGVLHRYALSATLGLQGGSTYTFTRLSHCIDSLTTLGVSPQVEWHTVEAGRPL